MEGETNWWAQCTGSPAQVKIVHMAETILSKPAIIESVSWEDRESMKVNPRP